MIEGLQETTYYCLCSLWLRNDRKQRIVYVAYYWGMGDVYVAYDWAMTGNNLLSM